MPLACAVAMSASSGSNGSGDIAASVRGTAARSQKQSPRRTTCATIALRCAAFVAATSWSISAWLFIPSPNASAQYARSSPAGTGVGAGAGSLCGVGTLSDATESENANR